MKKEGNNYAFIDGQNLYLSVRSLGWRLDYQRFRIYLAEKYAVKKAFLFIGFVAGNDTVYRSLQKAGYICVFKPTITWRNGSVKGNCDAELILHAMIEFNNYEAAVIVSGDGDFHCLAKYLLKQGKLKILLIPNRRKFSALLKIKSFYPLLRFLDEMKEKLSL